MKNKRPPKETVAIPEVPEAVTEPGDVWILGNHRVVCGDCTDIRTINLKLFQGKTAKLLFTSPPYDNQRAYQVGKFDWTKLMQGMIEAIPVQDTTQILINLGMVHREHEWQPYWNTWLQWMSEPFYMASDPEAGPMKRWRRFGLYIWDQGTGLPGDWNGRLAPSFEFIFHFNRKEVYPNKIVPCSSAGKPVPLNKKGGLREHDGIQASKWTHAGGSIQDFKIPDNIIRINRQASAGLERGHPAVFPIKLAEFIIQTFSNPDEIVYEPFGGSGSTLMAAENTGRICYTSELEPKYIDLICRRWMRMFVNAPKPVLEGSNQDFYQVADKRGIEVPDDSLLYRPETGTKRHEEINTLEEFL